MNQAWRRHEEDVRWRLFHSSSVFKCLSLKVTKLLLIQFIDADDCFHMTQADDLHEGDSSHNSYFI